MNGWKNARHVGWLGAAVCVVLLLDEFTGIGAPFERLGYLLEGSLVNAAVYVAAMVVLTSLSLLMLRARWITVALTWLFVVTLGTALELAFDIFTDRGFTEDFVAISLRELGMAPEAASAYVEPRVFFVVLGVTVLWIAVFAILRRTSVFGPLASMRAVAIAAAVMVALGVAWGMRFGHFHLYPTYLRTVFNVGHYYVQQATLPDRATPDVRLVEGAYQAERLVLIVDESIRPDFLGLNGAERPTTPYLDSIGSRLLNFGTAVSGSTCSDASNVMLNSFVRPQDVGDREAVLSRPTIFYYAKAAGYRTVLLSAVFRSPLFYGIRESDLAYLDETVMINELYDGEKERNDHRLIPELETLFEKYAGERLFVYMRKQGTHFPFDDYYPEDRRLFEPVLGSSRPMRAHRAALANSYANGIRWNLDDFYRELDRTVGADEAIYLFTSDHGENIELDEALLHCGRHPTMAMVPLWLDVRGPQTRSDFHERFGTAFAERNRDHAAHFNVFPTLLRLMGISAEGSPTLFDDLSSQVRTYHPPASHGTYETVVFDPISP